MKLLRNRKVHLQGVTGVTVRFPAPDELICICGIRNLPNIPDREVLRHDSGIQRDGVDLKDSTNRGHHRVTLESCSDSSNDVVVEDLGHLLPSVVYLRDELHNAMYSPAQKFVRDGGEGEHVCHIEPCVLHDGASEAFHAIR